MDDFYAARDTTTAPLPWPSIAPPFTLLSSASILGLCQQYDAKAKPALGVIGLTSSVMSGAGLLSQFQDPELYDFLLCMVMGFTLYQIVRVFWAGAWLLPNYEKKNTIAAYALVSIVGFGSYAAVSVTANLSATAGEISQNLADAGSIDDLQNASQDFASYVENLEIIRNALLERAAQARQLEQAEIAGAGPTGVPGRGPVSNSFGTAAQKYAQAAATLDQILSQAASRVTAMTKALDALRAAQIDSDLSGAARRAEIKSSAAKVISEMRALLALDPARAVRAAASSIATGVPNQSRANGQSQARITEISAGMRAYASQLENSATEIAARSPALPEQTTLSTAERLLETAWRLPALTMAALLLDLCGWIAIGYRGTIYHAYFAKRREETEQVVPNYLTLNDLETVGTFLTRMRDWQAGIEDGRPAPKRGRPKGSGMKALPKTETKTPNSSKEIKSGGEDKSDA